MKFLYADWLVTCDTNFTVIPNGAICFDTKIIDIDTLENLQKRYPDEKIEYLGTNSVLMPGLINTHVHLEFSANKTTLKYGNFVQWLFSVIKNREDLMEKANKKLIDEELEKRKSEIPSGKILIIDENPIRSFKASVRLTDMNILTNYYLTNPYSELKSAVENQTLFNE
jgi:hypothetical protein